MSTIFTNQNLTIVTAAGRASQVQSPGANVDLSADQTRQLAIETGRTIVTHSKASPISLVAGIELFWSDDVAQPSTTDPGLNVSVPLGGGTFYTTLLTLDAANRMAQLLGRYTVVTL
jgi:hypothetical protein